jgi:potassium-transporting ATPase KdpC subunit
MKQFLSAIRNALAATLTLAVVCGGIYPLIVFGIAQLAFRSRANGSLIVDAAGAVRGSKLVGQPFSSEGYFRPRPSAAGNGYDGANSSGSNLGPTSQKLRDLVRDRVAAYRAENGLQGSDAVPADAVTSSGSGLDPHISPRNAELQTVRVARARGLSVDKVRELVRQNTDAGLLAVLGQPRVNVLGVNLALDALRPSSAAK